MDLRSPSRFILSRFGFSLVLKRLIARRKRVNRFEIACGYVFGRRVLAGQSAAMCAPSDRDVSVFVVGSLWSQRSIEIRSTIGACCGASGGLAGFHNARNCGLLV